MTPPLPQEQVLLRAMDARAIWFIHPAIEGLAGSGVFVHGEWVGVSVQTSLREVIYTRARKKGVKTKSVYLERKQCRHRCVVVDVN